MHQCTRAVHLLIDSLAVDALTAGVPFNIVILAQRESSTRPTRVPIQVHTTPSGNDPIGHNCDGQDAIKKEHCLWDRVQVSTFEQMLVTIAINSRCALVHTGSTFVRHPLRLVLPIAALGHALPHLRPTQPPSGMQRLRRAPLHIDGAHQH